MKGPKVDLKDGQAIATGVLGIIGKGIFRELAQEGMHATVADLS